MTIRLITNTHNDNDPYYKMWMGTDWASGKDRSIVHEVNHGKLNEINLLSDGTYGIGLSNVKYKTINMDKKIAFSGSSGSGKTTLVKWLCNELNLKHISGSAGDVTTPADKDMLKNVFKYNGDGHLGVIRYSAQNPGYGITNQLTLQRRRAELIKENINFVTDRSPADNMTYFINQVGYHKEVTDAMAANFFAQCLEAWNNLTHVIYVKAVQPDTVEDNGSRISNKWYQWSVDAQFELWLGKLIKNSPNSGPKVLIIDFWDLKTRKEKVLNFINS